MATKKKELRNVNTRLFQEDIDFLKEEAEKQATSWQALLRSYLHQQIQTKRRGRKVK